MFIAFAVAASDEAPRRAGPPTFWAAAAETTGPRGGGSAKFIKLVRPHSGNFQRSGFKLIPMAANTNFSLHPSELDEPLYPHARFKLEEIQRDLDSLRGAAVSIGSTFLTFLIASAADEALDELRDDQLVREELEHKTISSAGGWSPIA